VIYAATSLMKSSPAQGQTQRCHITIAVPEIKFIQLHISQPVLHLPQKNVKPFGAATNRWMEALPCRIDQAALMELQARLAKVICAEDKLAYWPICGHDFKDRCNQGKAVFEPEADYFIC
jgi:hypothetical protein